MLARVQRKGIKRCTSLCDYLQQKMRNSCYLCLAVSVTSYTSQYWFIEIALSAHARSFGQLEVQMDAFQPLPLEAFHIKYQKMWAQMRPINQDKSDEDLKNFIDSQIAAASSKQMQFWDAFTEPFAAEVIAITVLSHALNEATINAALALGLEYSGKPELFSILEKADVKHKWTIGPQAFLPGYHFPKSNSMFEGLSTLCKRRNAYVHSKITFHNQSNQVIPKGSNDVGLSINDRKWLRCFLSLPYELHRHLLTQIEDKSLKFRLEHILKGKGEIAK